MNLLKQPLILVSTSPQRIQILRDLGISFQIAAPQFEEISDPKLSPQEEAMHFAKQKALSVAGQFPKALLLGCDTLVAFQDKKLGKPATPEQALEMLRMLRGKWHEVISAMALWDNTQKKFSERLVVVPVLMKEFSEHEARDYVETGEPIGKAGACCLQGLGSRLIERVEGEASAVVGLSVQSLREFGVF